MNQTWPLVKPNRVTMSPDRLLPEADVPYGPKSLRDATDGW